MFYVDTPFLRCVCGVMDVNGPWALKEVDLDGCCWRLMQQSFSFCRPSLAASSLIKYNVHV